MIGKRTYFAHPISDYGTSYERFCVTLLEAAGHTVENPNQPHHQDGYAEEGMDYFTKKVLPSCDGCAFLTFPGGLIGFGVFTEICHFLGAKQPVWEMKPWGGVELIDPTEFEPTVLTREETRGASKVFLSLSTRGRYGG